MCLTVNKELTEKFRKRKTPFKTHKFYRLRCQEFSDRPSKFTGFTSPYFPDKIGGEITSPGWIESDWNTSRTPNSEYFRYSGMHVCLNSGYAHQISLLDQFSTISFPIKIKPEDILAVGYWGGDTSNRPSSEIVIVAKKIYISPKLFVKLVRKVNSVFRKRFNKQNGLKKNLPCV